MSGKKAHHGKGQVHPKAAPPAPTVIQPGNQGADPTREENNSGPEQSRASPKLLCKLTGDQGGRTAVPKFGFSWGLNIKIWSITNPEPICVK
ncbi:MAG TPA: hypothetical protein VIH61_05285 [Waddliaceae bacterium]